MESYDRISKATRLLLGIGAAVLALQIVVGLIQHMCKD